MVKKTVWILDKKNNYPPLWEVGALTSNNLYMIAILFIIYWVAIYFYGYFKFNISIIVGFTSSLLFLYLYYYQYVASISIIGTADKKSWYYYYTPLYDQSTDLDTLNINYDMKELNNKTDGVVISDDLFNKLKKTNTFDSIQNFKGEITDGDNKLQDYLLKLLNFKHHNIVFQGYCLITILFTILTLTHRISKSLFKKVSTLFIHAAGLCIPIIFISFWFYNLSTELNISNIKITSLFLGTSITLSILVEIFCLYI